MIQPLSFSHSQPWLCRHSPGSSICGSFPHSGCVLNISCSSCFFNDIYCVWRAHSLTLSTTTHWCDPIYVWCVCSTEIKYYEYNVLSSFGAGCWKMGSESSWTYGRFPPSPCLSPHPSLISAADLLRWPKLLGVCGRGWNAVLCVIPRWECLCV